MKAGGIGAAALLCLFALRRVARTAAFQDALIAFFVKRQLESQHKGSRRWFGLRKGEKLEDDAARERQFAVVLVGTASPLAHKTRGKTCTAVIGG